MQLTLVTVSQLCCMFAFMAVGYFFRKKNIFPENAGVTLSRLLVNVLLPPMVILSLINNFKVEILKNNFYLLIFACIVLTVTGILAVFLARIFSKNKTTRGIYIYSFTIPNLGYMAYPIVKALFGETAFFNTLIYCLPYNIYIYTLGMYFLTSRKDLTVKTALKALFNPSMIATIIAMILGLLNVKLPGIITKTMQMAENCVTPCAMILTGTVFARINMKSVFTDYRSYIASFIRLVAIPVVALIIFRALHLPEEWILPSFVVLAMPMGVNSVVFPEAYGGDAESGAKVCFMSAILAIITIPLVFSLL